MGRLWFFLVFACLLAGCASLPGSTPTGDGAGAASAVAKFQPPVVVSKTQPGGEPVIAVASDGTLYVEGVGSDGRVNVNHIWRSADKGKSWVDVTPPATGTEESNDGFVSVGNGDTVYYANVAGLTLQMFSSTDKGATWIPVPAPHLPALMHRHWILPVGASTIHMAVEALPPGYAPRLVGRPPPVALPETPNQGMWYFRSDDKGQTWTTPVQIDPIVNFAGQGNMVVSKDGKSLYVLRYEEKQSPADAPTYEKGHWYLISSHDGGNSWKRTEAFDLTSELAAALPSTAIDSTGTLYTVWSQEVNGTSTLQLSYSKDQGVTWSAKRGFTDSRFSQAMPWIAVKKDGELGALWYEANMPGRSVKLKANWSIEYGDILGADTDSPRTTSVLVTPESVHDGNICAKGPACATGEDRRLLDYPWIAFGPDGSADLVFASTKWDHVSSFAITAVQAK